MHFSLISLTEKKEEVKEEEEGGRNQQEMNELFTMQALPQRCLEQPMRGAFDNRVPANTTRAEQPKLIETNWDWNSGFLTQSTVLSLSGCVTFGKSRKHLWPPVSSFTRGS